MGPHLACIHEHTGHARAGEKCSLEFRHAFVAGHEAAARGKGRWAHKGNVRPKHRERRDGHGPRCVAVALAQRTAQEHHLGGGHRAVNVVCNGEVCRHDGHLAPLAKGAHELEARGARVHEHGLARLHERRGNAGDGALCLDVHVDSQVLD